MLTWTEILRRAEGENPEPPRRVEKSDEQWQAQLSPAAYTVLRRHGTERPFSSEMCSLFEPGSYACAGCGQELFDSSQKFESGTGWPSFTQPVAENVIAYFADKSHGMVRVETRCASCDGHLGHVFPDGPKSQGGLRFCMNALALQKT